MPRAREIRCETKLQDSRSSKPNAENERAVVFVLFGCSGPAVADGQGECVQPTASLARCKMQFSLLAFGQSASF